jgi:hypothetical protein
LGHLAFVLPNCRLRIEPSPSLFTCVSRSSCRHQFLSFPVQDSNLRFPGSLGRDSRSRETMLSSALSRSANSKA